jgi:hypothetical protein
LLIMHSFSCTITAESAVLGKTGIYSERQRSDDF